ncbi:MAG: oligosaccharide flippase family protein [Phycisphaerae bacterium]|nr:oligosaccharide flippase family protein [Phycisphaerae bacterium]
MSLGHVKSLLASWTGYGANIVVMFFLSPFVVHELGHATFGLWSLLMSVTGYLGLVEIGVRASTGRYVNYYLGQGRRDRVDAVVNTSLVFYCFAGLAVLALSAALGAAFPVVFAKIPAELSAQAPGVLLLMAANVWLGLWSSTFGQLLLARNRFDLVNVSQIAALLVRAGVTVAVLWAGGSLAAMSGAIVLASVVQLLLNATLARRYGVRVTFSRRLASWACLREMFGFGVWSFLGNTSTRVIFYASATIIGVMLGEREIAYYSVGLILIDTGRELVAFVCRVLTPDLQKQAGRSPGDMGGRMIAAANTTMLVAVGLLGGLVAIGPAFLRQWMGPDFARSGDVLVIVSLSQLGVMANFACNTTLNAMGHVRLVAGIFAVEAVLNVAVSVLLVSLGWGIVGVACGTAGPAVMCSGLVTMVFACRRTGMPIGRYAAATAARWLPAAILYVPLCCGVHYGLGFEWIDGARMPMLGWGVLLMQIALCGLLYVPIAATFLISREQRAAVWKGLASLRCRVLCQAKRFLTPSILPRKEARRRETFFDPPHRGSRRA